MKGIYQVNGQVIFHDPTPDMVAVFAEIDSSFSIQSTQPDPNFIPKFQQLRAKCFRANKPLIEMDVDELKSIFDEIKKDNFQNNGEYIYSGLDVLYALSLNNLSECRLCGWNCGKNRYRDMTGRCGLSNKNIHSRPFIHIAEESVINPAIVSNFAGCALRCKYCIDYELWDSSQMHESDPKIFWQEVRKLKGQNVPVNSLEFTNPTESVHNLVHILSNAPKDFNRPIVLNCHLYGSKLFYNLAAPITDVWLPDLRYGNDECAKSLSGVDNYMQYAKIGLDLMTHQCSKIIVRILVLPGHIPCCHEPAIKLLSEYNDKIWVSILDQYVPENDAYLDSNLRRRPTKEEISQVKALADKYGLRNVESGSAGFWKE